MVAKLANSKKRTMDDKDKRIVSILYEDGRVSLSKIGEQLDNMSHVAVSKRLEKLKSEELVKITAAVNVENLDVKVIFLGLETETIEVADRIIEKYRHCPRLLMLAPVTGRYNLFAVMVAEDLDSLESMLGTCSMRVEEGVRRSETWFGNAPVTPQYLPIDLDPSRKGVNEEECGCLCANCRRHQMKKCVGCPESEVYSGHLWASKEA